jgi:hypothetical protein
MPFLLGQPHLLLFNALQDVPATITTINTTIRYLFKFFIWPLL